MTKIIDKIKKYTEEKNKEITKILNIKKKYRLEFLKENKKKAIGIFDNKKLLLVGDYSFYGIYQPYTKLWIWASSIPGVDKQTIKNIDKLKKMAYLFEEESDSKNTFYYQLLTQDVLLINNDKSIEWINQLLLYYSNGIYHFNPVNNDGNIQFIILSDIKEKYF